MAAMVIRVTIVMVLMMMLVVIVVMVMVVVVDMVVLVDGTGRDGTGKCFHYIPCQTVPPFTD